MEKLKVGDKVMWRGAFGMDAPKVAEVTGMEVTERSRDKHGESVSEVSWELVRANIVAFSLTYEGEYYWAYSDQISQYNGGE